MYQIVILTTNLCGLHGTRLPMVYTVVQQNDKPITIAASGSRRR